MLFLRETSERTMIWEGHQCTPAEAQDLTGIAHIHALGEFKTIFHRLMGQALLYISQYQRVMIGLLILSRPAMIVLLPGASTTTPCTSMSAWHLLCNSCGR